MSIIRVRVIRERLSATPEHVIAQGPAPGGQIVHCGGGGGECTGLVQAHIVGHAPIGRKKGHFFK